MHDGCGVGAATDVSREQQGCTGMSGGGGGAGENECQCLGRAGCCHSLQQLCVITGLETCTSCDERVCNWHVIAFESVRQWRRVRPRPRFIHVSPRFDEIQNEVLVTGRCSGRGGEGGGRWWRL